MTRPICAVDFTTDSVSILVQRRPGELQAIEASLPTEAIEDGRILQPVAVQLFLARMLKDASVEKPEIRVALSDSACVSRFLDYPRMPDRDLEQSLRIEAGRELPVNPRNAYLGWQVVRDVDSRRRVLLVAAWRDVVEGYLEATDGLGTVKVIEPRALAIARAVGMPDSTVLEWADNRLQLTQVQDRLVQYTTSVAVHDGAHGSSPQLLRLLASLLPTVGGRRSQLGDVVLLGKLHGREDVEAALREFAESDMQTAEPVIPDPYGQFVGTAQMANVGLLMRD